MVRRRRKGVETILIYPGLYKTPIDRVDAGFSEIPSKPKEICRSLSRAFSPQISCSRICDLPFHIGLQPTISIWLNLMHLHRRKFFVLARVQPYVTTFNFCLRRYYYGFKRLKDFICLYLSQTLIFSF